MNSIFFETSALIEFTFCDKTTKKKILELVPSYSEKRTSRYVIYEICRGFLRYLILLHNKAHDLERFSELMGFASRVRRQGHYQGAILGAFERYFQSRESEVALSDEHRLIDFRGNMRRMIRRGWVNIDKKMDQIINEVGCREDLQSPFLKDELYKQLLEKEKCGIRSNCGLKKYVTASRNDFEKIKDKLEHSSDLDDEQKKQIHALRELYRVCNRNFDKWNCYKCADIIIAHESPPDCILISKNQKHLEGICSCFGKKAAFYI